MSKKNILNTLSEEHEQLRGLFARMEKTSDAAAKTREALLSKIEHGLIPHAKWEEAVFYPAFKERADREGLKTHAEAVTEHLVVEEVVIPSVKAAEFGTPQFAGRVKVFGELIDHHATEEEKTMFKMAKIMFSAEELGQLDEQYEQWKSSPDGLTAVAFATAESNQLVNNYLSED